MTAFFPLPTISAYLCREFLRFFFLCLSLFLVLALLIDFFDRLDDFIKYAASASAVLRYLLFKTPLLLTQAAPAAALAASFLSLGLLSRHREILALKACGISSLQIARALLFTAGVLSAAVWVWGETAVPYAFHRSRYINTVEIKKKPFRGLFNERGFWYHGRNAFYHIDHFDSRRNILFGLTMYTLDENFRVLSLTEVAQARWQDGQWHFDHIKTNAITPEYKNLSSPIHPHLEETPEDFALVDMEAEEFSTWQFREYIADLQRKGLDTTEYQVDLQLKGAVPAATLAMSLLGVALASSKAGQLAVSTALGSALVAGFGYWILLALTVSLGHSGILSPFPAAWLANGVAFLLGIFFLLGRD
ncbi:MAG: LPS export ABC transporter permease LptG [Thermodesulfobacteriota bacterium]|jgi:lipopolysaccharide export system permease protein